MIGDGPERAALETFAQSNGIADQVFFTGYVADPIVWMMRANVLVLTSLYEGLGNVIIEALACGTPVVCTDCPYGPREILRSGRYGTLTPVGDSAKLSAAIDAALDRAPERKVLMRHGLEYTAERAAAQLLEIVGDLQITPAVSTRSSIGGLEDREAI
jgi:glycosyltransferase involved in cell wall biosynthesis